MEQLELDKRREEQALELDTKRQLAGTDVALMPNTVLCLEGRCILGAPDTCSKLYCHWCTYELRDDVLLAIESLTTPGARGTDWE